LIDIAVDSSSNAYVLGNKDPNYGSFIDKFDKFGHRVWDINAYNAPSGIAVSTS